jgi:hypothetical protein
MGPRWRCGWVLSASACQVFDGLHGLQGSADTEGCGKCTKEMKRRRVMELGICEDVFGQRGS